MSVIIALAALALLMLAAYRGYSVILFAPIAALGAVLLTDPGAVGPAFTGLFMEKMVGFVKLYFPVFLLGAVFGKLIELSGFSRSIVAAAIRILGRRHAIPVIVLVCALLTYGGVSLFVVAFAVYPFAAELFRQSGIPKRLIPATVAPRGILVYHGRPARHAADPEYYSHQLLRHQRLGGPLAGAYRLAVHYHLRFAVAGASAPQSAGPRRRLWDRPAK
ncbi:D-beta-hydroxybutyrate permease [Klebsiella pneumoniae subsp. rhinoscleromatis]|nr:D-beta-hydroxybutyrate permease [Klebsiella pneumoniae subsp. rhinoscleromatis]